jgi:RHS repeat-associated protein
MGYGAATGGKLEFTGKERDAETGLDYFGARYMSSTQARFTSIDPKVFSRRTIEHPQKWNKYAYVQNNPLTSIDPNGLDDYRVFITAPEAGGGNWAAAKKSAEANGHTMQIFRGSEASIQNYNKAISDTSARVVLAGHSTFDPATHITNGVPLGNGTSYGTTSTHSDMDLRTDPPTLSPTFFQTTNVSANSVALFACDSIAIAGQYSGAGLFVGMDSGADHLSSLSAMGAAAAAWVMADAQSRPDSTGQSTFVGPVSPIANANTAFNQNAGGQPGVYTDQGDKVVEVKKDPKP